MTTRFPGQIDALFRPTAETELDDAVGHPDHAGLHCDTADAIEAVQSAVGVAGSADPNSLQHRVTSASAIAAGAAAMAAAHVEATAPHSGHATPASVTAALSAHVAAADPHPVYTTQAGVDARIGALAPAETATTLGAVISGAPAKTTPVDADSLPLSDSAAAGSARKVTWASVKTALASFLDALYVRISGAPGGQTLNGGTGSGEAIVLSSTSSPGKGKIVLGSAGTSAYDEASSRLGVGTANPSAPLHVVSTGTVARLGYDAGAYADISLSSAGVITLAPTGGTTQCRTLRSTATLGTELVVNGGFSTDLSGWTDSGSSWSWSAGAAAHTPGSASTLSQSITVASGSTYEVGITMARTAGSIGISIGSAPAVLAGTSTAFSTSAQRTVVATASGSVALTISPTADFAGSIDWISVRLVALSSVTPAIAVLDTSGASACEIRATAASSMNTSVGTSSHGSLVSGASNTAVGNSAQFAMTDGVANCAFGTHAQRNTTIGSSNCGIGRSAQYNLTSGYDNTSLGFYAQQNLVAGYSNVTVGARSAVNLADGVAAATDFVRCIHIGTAARVSAAGATNEIAIGDGAIGLGSNTTVLGNASTTKTKIFGTPVLVPAAASVPTANGELSIEATSNSSLTFRLRGSDGTVRSASLALT